jgi:hypothetical protein
LRDRNAFVALNVAQVFLERKAGQDGLRRVSVEKNALCVVGLGGVRVGKMLVEQIHLLQRGRRHLGMHVVDFFGELPQVLAKGCRPGAAIRAHIKNSVHLKIFKK